MWGSTCGVRELLQPWTQKQAGAEAQTTDKLLQANRSCFTFFHFFFMSYLFTLLLSKSRCSATTLDFSRSRLCSSWRMRACSILVWVYGQKKETKTGKRDPGRKGQGEENTETQTMRIRGGIGKVRTAVVTWSKCGFVEQKKSSDHMIERVKHRGWWFDPLKWKECHFLPVSSYFK